MSTEGVSVRTLAVVFIIAAVAAGVALMPPLPGTDSRMMLAAGLAVFAVGLWATAVISEATTAIMFFALAMITQVAPASDVFSAFHSSAIWLIFGGLVLGVAADRTGVGRYIASKIVSRTGRSYTGLLLGIVLGALVLGFLIPSSMGRVLLFYPVVKALTEDVGFAKGSSGAIGLICAMILGGYLMASTILPANVPNVIMLGLSETLFDAPITYGEYLKQHFPVMGILRGVIGIFVIRWLFPATIDPNAINREAVTLSRDGRLMMLLLAVTLTFWMTDSVHGISPGWISLAAAAICLFPGIGFVPEEDFQRRVSLGMIIYVAGTIAVGAIITSTGFDNWLGGAVQSVLMLSPESSAQSYASIVGLSVVGCFALTMAGVMPVLVPIAQDLASASGLSLYAVLMMLVVATTVPLLPYQSGPIVLLIRLAGVRFRDIARFLIPMALIAWLVLFPLNYLWWRFLGVFG